tara:strand:- start:115 stop:348 length:234 start_codon:yes stop_codon:yes gene_type:complete
MNKDKRMQKSGRMRLTLLPVSCCKIELDQYKKRLEVQRIAEGAYRKDDSNKSEDNTGKWVPHPKPVSLNCQFDSLTV